LDHVKVIQHEFFCFVFLFALIELFILIPNY